MAGSAAPDWLGSLPGRPVVYVTLGTVWNQDQSIFRTILGGLAGRAGRVIVALGPGQDPAALGPQPPTVRVCDVVPHAVLMDRCDLVVCHGGAGTVLDALAAGVPLLLLPQAADQFYNADRVVAARAGVCLRRGELTPEAIASAAGLLLDEPGYRRAAAAIAAEVGAMPPATAVVPVLARLSRPRPPAARRAPGAT
jgi:MGT family glycosyltransferase